MRIISKVNLFYFYLKAKCKKVTNYTPNDHASRSQVFVNNIEMTYIQ